MALTNPMTKGIYLGLKPMIVNNTQVGIVPNVGGNVTFYAAGTTSPATVYTDPALTVPYPSPSNVVNLNASGFAVIYLQNAAYKYVESDSFGNPIFVQDNYLGGAAGAGFGGAFVENIAALKFLNTNTFTYAFIAGYLENGDGAEGFFYNQTSLTPDDGGYTIKSTFDATKNWFRIPDENGDVRAASFGYLPQNTGDQTTSLQAADVYAATIGSRLRIQGGNQATIQSIVFNSPEIYLELGTFFQSSVDSTLTFNGTIEGPPQNVFGLNITVVLSSNQISDHPEWFGAALTSGDNTAAFAAWITAGGGVFVLPPGAWNYATPSSFPWPQVPVILNGTLVGNVTYPVGLRLPDLSAIRTNEIILENGIILGNFSTTGLQINGDLKITGSTITVAITSSGLIRGNDGISGISLASDSSVVAGTVLQANMGNTNLSFYASGNAQGGIQNAANIDISPLTILIPAHSLNNDGDRLVIEASGAGQSSSSTNTFTLKMGHTSPGTTTVFSALVGGATLSQLNHWILRATVTINSTIPSNNMTVDGILMTDCVPNGAPAQSASIGSFTIQGFNNTSDLYITLGAASTATAYRYTADFIPAHP